MRTRSPPKNAFKDGMVGLYQAVSINWCIYTVFLSACLSVVCMSVCLCVCGLSTCLCISGLFVCLFACLYVCLCVCVSVVCLSVCGLYVCLSVCVSVCLSVCLSACLPACMSVCLSVYLCIGSLFVCGLYVCLSVCVSVVCLSVCLFVYQCLVCPPFSDLSTSFCSPPNATTVLMEESTSSATLPAVAYAPCSFTVKEAMIYGRVKKRRGENWLHYMYITGGIFGGPQFTFEITPARKEMIGSMVATTKVSFQFMIKPMTKPATKVEVY